MAENDTSIAALETIVDDAIAVTFAAPAASTIDEQQVIRRLDAVLSAIVPRAPDVISVLGTLKAKLEQRLNSVPEDVGRAAHEWRVAMLKWRPVPPAMPRSITAFVVLERLGVAEASCSHELKKARYQALRKPGDQCDCAARIVAQYLFGRPDAPLELVDSSGVAYAATEYVWLCRACGTEWRQDESHDDSGSHSDWTPAPSAQAGVRED